MTQNNIYMEDDNLVIYVDVLPEIQDTVQNASLSAAASAESANESATTSANLLESIRGIKTGAELFMAQATENLQDLYTNLSAQLSQLGNTVVNNINTKCHSVLQLIQQSETRVLSMIQARGSSYVNEAKSYAIAAQEIVDFHVSTEHLNQSKCLLTGNVSDDSTALECIKSYAHSTFDVSKFTVAGTPIITANGIASGFSDSNYLSIPNAVVSKIDSGNAWKINFKGVMTPTGNEASSITGKTADVVGRLNIGLLNGTQNFYLQFYDNTNTAHAVYIASVNTSGNRGKPYIGYASYDGNETYKLALSFDNGETWLSNTGTFTQKVYIGSYNLLIGYKYGGSIDLKQFSITVDGVEVFNGNKTGIDTIKPDDYTVVGTPTISADGIASGFSVNDYLTIDTSSVDWRKPYKIKIKCKLTSSIDGLGTLTYGNMPIIRNHSGKFQFSPASDYDHLSTVGDIEDSASFSLNTNYVLLIEFDGSNYSFSKSIDNGQTYSLIGTKTTSQITTDLTTGGTSQVGNSLNYQPTRVWQGSIDLNGFKIYVDGDLVYQPCLKIPYTESHSGSKIADAIYRDRVTDAYEQGYVDYHYYTLSDTDFTLPMGDIYGMIENKIGKTSPHIIDTYVNGASWYRVYSDGWIEQGGFAETPITVNLLKNFSNTNYNVQITATEPVNSANYQNYSATGRTTSSFYASFSTTAYHSGILWFACGY